MLLAIDVGNTNTVFALYDAGVWIHNWRISTDKNRTADEYASWFFSLATRVDFDISKIKNIIIGSVVPIVVGTLIIFFKEWLKIKPIIADDSLSWDCDVLIDNPRELGVDRRLNALAAYLIYKSSAIIVDFGTATTFDIVDEKGSYLGGVIAPGINLSIEALYKATAKLPNITLSYPDSVIGKDTISAMNAGIFWGYVSLIRGLLEKIKIDLLEKKPNINPLFIATGGLAIFFEKKISIFDIIVPDLTLNGLRFLAEKNISNIL